VAQQFVPSQADGWNHALGELGRFYEDVQVRDAPGPDLLGPERVIALASAVTPTAIYDLTGGYIESAVLLGRRTAELHLALAGDTRTEGFAPEPFTGKDYERLLSDALGQADRALELLGTRPAAGEDGARQIVERAAGALRRLQQGDAAQLAEVGTTRTRVHGDYHLGQVLWSEGDFYILDFEGEPARPLEERRKKESPFKDVAGMLRSFSYAAHAGLFIRAAGQPDEFDRLDPWARTWARWAGASFLKGYLAVAGDAPFVPADPSQRAALLDLFLFDKALYELNYELNNRPDWVRIPLRGLSELVAAASPDGSR